MKSRWYISVGIGLIILGIVVIVLWPVLTQAGLLDQRHDWILNPFALGQTGSALWSAWQTADLGNAVSFGNDLVVRILMWLLNFVHVTPMLWSKQVLVVVLVSAGWSMSAFLLRVVKVRPAVALIGGLLYLTSPFVYDRLLLGYLWHIGAYALLPLFLWVSLALLEQKRWSWSLAALCALIYVIAGTQIHFLVIYPIVLGLVTLILGQTKRLMGLTLFQIGIALLVNLSWIIPLTSNGSIQAIAMGATVTDWVSSRVVVSWIQQLTLTNHPNQYAAQILQSNQTWTIVLLLLMAFGWGAVVFKSARRDWSTVSVACITLGIGIVTLLTPPFSPTVGWLFDHIAIVRMFREPVHWMGLVGFGVTILAALGLDRLFGTTRIRAIGTVAFALVALGIISQPFWDGHLVAGLGATTINPNYVALDAQQASVAGRSFWWPAIGPFHYQESPATINFDPVIESFSQPSFPSEGGRLFYAGRPTQIRNFFIDRLTAGDTALDELFTRTNLHDLFVRSDVASDYTGVSSLGAYPDANQRITNSPVDNELRAISSLKLVETLPNANHYALNRPSAAVDIAKHPLATGRDLSALQTPSDAIFFLDPVVSPLVSSGTIPLATDELSQIEAQLTQNALEQTEPGPSANVHFDARAGWTRSLYWWWRDPFVAAAREQAIISETDDSLTIPLTQATSGTTVWIKAGALVSKTELEVTAGNSTKTITPAIKAWSWFPAIQIPAGETVSAITIRSRAGIPLVASVIVALNQLPPLTINPVIPTAVTATINAVNRTTPSNVTVTATAATPFWLVFRESFNPGWVAHIHADSFTTTAPSVLVDGYANAFYIPTTGNLAIDLTYEPQQRYSLGLAVSLLTLCILALSSAIDLRGRIPLFRKEG